MLARTDFIEVSCFFCHVDVYLQLFVLLHFSAIKKKNNNNKCQFIWTSSCHWLGGLAQR